jgi:hypothetical protein
MANIEQVQHNGNGSTYTAPTSRRAFLKSAPSRIGFLEDQIEEHEHRLDTITDQLPDPAADKRCVAEIYADILVHEHRLGALAVRVANLADLTKTVERLTQRLGRIDRRSLRTRRKVAAIERN